eukprot:27708-Chlamydomonas_euryale.AAC.5
MNGVEVWGHMLRGHAPLHATPAAAHAVPSRLHGRKLVLQVHVACPPTTTMPPTGGTINKPPTFESAVSADTVKMSAAVDSCVR